MSPDTKTSPSAGTGGTREDAGPKTSALGDSAEERVATGGHNDGVTSPSEPPAQLVPATTLSGGSFPLDSFREAARELRRPFTENAIKFKVQTVWPKGNNPTGALIVTYIDARLVVERLNLVLPHLWFDEYEPVAGGDGLLCNLTVDGITRKDVGSGYKGKGLFSDALKRAAVKFGVGVSLYAIPRTILNLDDNKLLEQKKAKDGKTLALTPTGETRCRTLYASWLDTIGREAFGEPLDHGDVEGAAGDLEAETEDRSQAQLSMEESEAEKLTDAKATALIEAAEKLHKKVPKKDMPTAAFKRQLAGVWHSHEELEKFVETLEGMQ